MSSTQLGLIELLLVLGPVVGFCIYELVSLYRPDKKQEIPPAEDSGADDEPRG